MRKRDQKQPSPEHTPPPSPKKIKKNKKNGTEVTVPRVVVNKIRQINDTLSKKPPDMVVLRKIAVGGLVNNSLRCKVWPLLLGIEVDEVVDDHVGLIVKHRDWEQVERDIERSLFKLTGGNQELLQQKRKELANIINAILSTNQDLNYFQGYHDIASVLLMVCGEKQAYTLLKKISLYHIRDYLNDNLEAVMQLLHRIFPLLKVLDEEVHRYIVATNLEPYFALSWVLTWFSHSVDDLPTIARLFDFFLTSHPFASVYMSVAVVIYRREQLLRCSREYSAIHTFLSKIPPDLPFEILIEKTTEYLERYPPGGMVIDFVLSGSNMPCYPFEWIRRVEEKEQSEKEKQNRKWRWVYVSVAVVLLSVAVGLVVFKDYR